MAQPTSLSTVQRLYLAYYGRPADPAGLQFWANKLEAAQGSLAGITDAFANSAESQALFGSSTTHREHVTLIYQQLLGRNPEVQGLNYYVDQLNRGKITLVNAALSILDGAQGADLTRVQQREAAATQFTAALDLPKEQAAYVGEAKAQIVRDALASVTDQASTLSAFSAGLDGLVLRLLGGQLVQGSVTAGPIVEGNGLQVTAYDAQGNVLGSGALNPDGSYRISIEREYTGPIVVRVVDTSQGADYVDETQAKPVDLSSDLRALSTVAGAGSYTININPITELITRRVGLQGGDNATSQLVLGATTPEQIQTATQEIASALGLGNVNPVTTTPVPTVTATGSANPAADTLGRVLAAISGQENGQNVSTDRVLNTLLGNLTGSGAQTQLNATGQRDLLIGAATSDLSGAVGVTGSLAQNLGTPASTAAQIQNTIKQLADLADKKITSTTLTPADFAAIGVTGVTNENLGAVLNQVAQQANGAAAVNSLTEIQNAVVSAPAPAPAPAPSAPPPPPANAAPTITTAAVVNASTSQITFTANDADANDTLSTRVGTTAVSLGTVNKGSSSTLTLAAQGTAVVGELNVFDGTAASPNLGLYVGLGTDSSQAAPGNDTLTRPNSTNRALFYGFGGDDTLTGGTGSDTLVGGTGNDTFAYSFDTTAFATSNAFIDVISGGDGDQDTLLITPQTNTSTFALGSNGSPLPAISYANVTGVEVVKIGGATSGAINLVFAENAFSTAGIRKVDLSADTLTGGTNTIDAASQADTNISLTLVGSAGVDTITGGAGNNSITGGGGFDSLTGGAGDDTLDGGAEGDALNGGDGSDTLMYGAFGKAISGINNTGGTTLIAVGIDRLTLGVGDKITLPALTQGTYTLGNQGNAVTVAVGTSGSATTGTALQTAIAAAVANPRSNTAYVLTVTDSGNSGIFTGSYLLVFGNGATAFDGSNDLLLKLQNPSTGFGFTASGTTDLLYTLPPQAPTVTTTATVSASNPLQITFTAADVDTTSLSARIGTTPLLGGMGTVSNGSTSTLTLAAQTSAVQGELNVFDGTSGTNLGLYLGLGTDASGDTLTQTGSNKAALYGFGGNDILTGGSGNDSLFGGTGTDTVTYDLATGGTDQINLGVETAGVASLTELDVLNLSRGGSDARLILDVANVGNGTGVGTQADAELTAGQRNTVILADGSGVAKGYVDDEGLLIAYDTNSGGMTVRDSAAPGTTIGASRVLLAALGTGGNDTLSIANSTGGGAYVNGGSGNDTLAVTGSSGNNYLDGGSGDDTLTASNNTIDTLQGGTGNDELIVLGTNGPSTMLFGGDGTDTVTVRSNLRQSDDSAITGVEVVRASAGTSNITIELVGQTEGFTLQGNDGDNQLRSSNTGASTVTGGAGNDLLAGGAAGDSLNGGAGNDTLEGNAGADTLEGGIGIDTYRLGQDDNAIDTVIENGSAVAVAVANGAITGFDVVEAFNKGQDVLTFNSGTGKQLAGNYSSGTFTVGTTSAHNDVIVFNDVNNNGVVDAGEAAVVVAGVDAAGAAVDLNGSGADNGYALATPAVVANLTPDGRAIVVPSNTTDPLFTSQWYLKNTGQRGTAPAGTTLLDLNILPVWARGITGKGTVVAITDDGIDLNHEDLSNQLLKDKTYNPDAGLTGVDAYTAGNGYAPPADAHQHGTVVGSIVGMEAQNNKGMVGIAFGTKLVSTMSASSATTANAQTFDYLKGLSNLGSTSGGVDVSVNSYGLDPAFSDNYYIAPNGIATTAKQKEGQAIEQAATTGRGGKGIVIEVSAGNEAANRADPGMTNFTGSRFIIASGAVTELGYRTDYSTPGASVLVSAFGGVGTANQDVNSGYGAVSADITGIAGYNTTSNADNSYAYQNQGTSYSGPMVGATAALMLQANPNLGFRDVSTILAMTARKTGATAVPDGLTGHNLNTYINNGAKDWNLGGMHFSRDVGYGLIDVTAAVQLAESWTLPAGTAGNWQLAQAAASAPPANPTNIPDNDPTTGLTVTANVQSNVRIERMEFELDLSANLPSQLKAVVTSPNGTTITLFDQPLTKQLTNNQPVGNEAPWPGVFSIGSTAFLGETSAGNWTLKLFDVVTGEEAQYRSLNVKAWGSAITDDSQYVMTREFTGTPTLTDGAGTDLINAAALQTAVNIDLRATGTTGATTSTVGSGSFTIASGSVIENATGGSGADTLIGNAAANLLRGNLGADTLTGGSGADTFYYFLAQDSTLTAGDTIQDFSTTDDKLDVSSLDANTATAANDDFTFLGISALTAYGLRYEQTGGNTLVQADLDGNASTIEFQVTLVGTLTLSAENFSGLIPLPT